MLIYIGAAIAVVLLALLYHYIPSRKIFFAFFFVLCAASAIVFFAWPSPHRNGDAVISQEMREERQQQGRDQPTRHWRRSAKGSGSRAEVAARRIWSRSDKAASAICGVPQA